MIRVAVAACVVSLFVADTVAGRDASSSQQVSAKQTVFRDAVAESPAGPDVRLVTVSSDADLLTFRIDVPTHRVLTEDMRLRVWLDADDDRKTGLAVEGLEGFDHHLVVDRWELGYGAVGLFRCSGSVCSGGRDPESSLRFAYADGATFAIEARELGLRRLERVSFSVVVTTGIRFDPVARSYDVTNARLDTAPEPGTVWTYDARVLRVTSFSAAPAKVRAGTLHIMRLGAIRHRHGKGAHEGQGVLLGEDRRQGRSGARPALRRPACGLRVCRPGEHERKAFSQHDRHRVRRSRGLALALGQDRLAAPKTRRVHGEPDAGRVGARQLDTMTRRRRDQHVLAGYE